MSVNQYKPHVFILPEDDANRQIAIGFELEIRNQRSLQVLQPAGGWSAARDLLLRDHIHSLKTNKNKHIIVLVDFDEHKDRIEKIIDGFDEDAKERIFILGTWSEPERLRTDLRMAFEDIGVALATNCRDSATSYWDHDLLKHNQNELERLRAAVRAILFD